MPIKITKKSKRTKKGKGKVSQSQQVIVNIQKGKRKASSQPVIRQSQAPIIVQPPQQDFSQLENLFRQYSTSRSVTEPVKQVLYGVDTQTETPIMVDKKTQVKSVNPVVKLEQQLTEEQQRLQEKLFALEGQRPIPVARQRQPAPQRPRQISLSPFPVRANAPPPTPDKVLNPDTNRMINVGGSAYKKLVKEGKIIPEKMN
jgi:hypothetical protein